MCPAAVSSNIGDNNGRSRPRPPARWRYRTTGALFGATLARGMAADEGVDEIGANLSNVAPQVVVHERRVLSGSSLCED